MSPSRPLSPRLAQTRRGVALISVLVVLVLATALIVGFLVRAGYEGVASGNYRATATTRLLSDTAINLVQAEINEATDTSAGEAWASQPGAIRVFGGDGKLSRIYRLYSAESQVTNTSDGAVLAGDIPPANWAGLPSQWVDLNAPVRVAAMTGNSNDDYLVYPIIDPRDPNDPGTLKDPKVTSKMPGFSIASNAPVASSNQPAPMPVRWLYVLQDGQILAPDSGITGKKVTFNQQPSTNRPSASNPIVGRIAFWTDDETSKVNINTAAGSLADWNGQHIPGTWDTPRFKVWFERMLFSENQPAKGEFQRYPGHPATTSLFGVLDALGVDSAGYPYSVSSPNASPQVAPSSDMSGLFSLLPRYSDDNSSRAGSRNTTRATPAPVINNGDFKNERLYSSVGELLYNPTRTAGSFTRQQLESGKFFLTAQSRAPEVTLFGTPRLAMWPVHESQSSTTRTAFDNLVAFCSTIAGDPYYIQRRDSRSASYDYNSIGRNQEIYSYLKAITSKDISGFGGDFSGKYSYDNMNERDQILAQMIDYIRCTNLHDNSVPESTTSFTRFTANPSGLPGYNFQGQVTPLKIVQASQASRGLGRIQTFSEIGIHIICTAEGSSKPYFNKVTGAETIGYFAPELISNAKVSPIYGSANDPAYASNLPEAQYLRDGSGKIVGWDATNKQVLTGTETTLPAGAAPFPSNPTLTTTGAHGGPLQALLPGEKKLQAMLLFELACPMMGYDPFKLSTTPGFKVNVSGIQNIVISGENPFPSRTTVEESKESNLNGNGLVDMMSTRTNVYGTGGLMGFRYLIGDKNDRFNAWSGNNPYTSGTRPYRYVSNPFKVSSPMLTLSGGFTAELHVPTAPGASAPYQVFNVTFPFDPANPVGIPVPDLMKNGLSGNDRSGNPFAFNVAADWWGFDFRIARSTSARNNGDISALIHGPGAVIRADMPVTGTWNWGSRRNVTIPTFANQDNGSFSGSDVVRTLVARDGDYRLAAARDPVMVDGSTTSPFAKGPGYNNLGKKLGHLFKDQGNTKGTAGVDNDGKLVKDAPYSWRFTPKVPSGMDPAKQRTWDWDNGLPNEADGAYAGKPDEGNIYVNNDSPYYNREQEGSMDKISSYFTANRIVSSPVMFGSLPSGVVESVSWRTLLFRPQANRPYDPNGPKDHLFLDLFWMPVVEPYAISEPFSTAGKVNMNYQIVPFTYIKRSTGVQAVLESELIPRVPLAAAAAVNSSGEPYYKGKPGSSPSTPPGGKPSVARLPLNLSETDGALRQFKDKFDNWDVFKSASEICDVYLTPSGYSWTSNAGADDSWYGDDFALVGDNSRERPYSNIYPRLTTKSNTFTVHYTVQSLKNASRDQAEWDEGRGAITGEFRGSTTIERYIDPNNNSIPDYATDSNAASLDSFYQWRVIANNAFSP